MSRNERLTCAIFLLAFVALRVVGGRTLAFDLLDPEVLLNLRLAQQLQTDLPVGDLGRYWYTGAGANVGAGPLVMSFLYVPASWFVDADFAAVRLVALFWSVLGALAMAGIGRQILGAGGAAAGLGVTLAMPPTWLAWSLMGVGNYVEGAVLTLLAAWMVLRLVRGADAWALPAGALLTFGAWFSITTVPPSAFLLVLVLALRRPRALAWLAAGLLLGAVPWMVGVETAFSSQSPVQGDDVRAVLVDVLSRPLDWPSLLWGSLMGTPTLSYREVTAEDWAPAWLILLEGPLVAASWFALFFVTAIAFAPTSVRRQIGLRDSPAAIRWFVALAAGVAVAEPTALSALGFGPEGVPAERIWTFVPRRIALVHAILALAWASLGWALWHARGFQRVPARALATAGLLLGFAGQVALVTSAEPPPSSFHPARYLLCPAEAPVDQESVCIGSLWEDQVELLEATVLRPELQPVKVRRAVLQGFGRVERDEGSCALSQASSGGEAVGGRTLDSWAAWGAGLALESGCDEGRAAELCLQTPDPPACEEGRAEGR